MLRKKQKPHTAKSNLRISKGRIRERQRDEACQLSGRPVSSQKQLTYCNFLYESLTVHSIYS